MKIRPVGAELFHADGQKNTQLDMTKVVTFRNFVKAPKILWTRMTSNNSHLNDNNAPI